MRREIFDYLLANFLTSQPQIIETTPEQPQWLAFVRPQTENEAVAEMEIQSVLYSTDGRTFTKTIETMPDVNTYNQIDTSFGTLWREFCREKSIVPVAYDVFGVSVVSRGGVATTERNRPLGQRYLLRRPQPDERCFGFVNSMGGFDTLKEFADALGNDPDFAATVARGLAGKVDKVEGKQLSTEDYTTDEKATLATIDEHANNYTHPTAHPASMIAEDATRRFVSDSEKQTWNGKQDALVSGRSIKTINGQSLLGKGNIAIAGGGSGDSDIADDFMLVRTGRIVGIGQTWQQPLSFTLRIGNYREELLDPNQYRLVFMFTRKVRYKRINSGIRWVVPMIAATKENLDGTHLPENETYVPITGKQLAVTFPNHFRPKLRYYNSRFLFRQTNNSRLKIGVAIFKYTGASDPGWYRCSNIYGVEYYLGDRGVPNTAVPPKQINTRYITTE